MPVEKVKTSQDYNNNAPMTQIPYWHTPRLLRKSVSPTRTISSAEVDPSQGAKRKLFDDSIIAETEEEFPKPKKRKAHVPKHEVPNKIMKELQAIKQNEFLSKFLGNKVTSKVVAKKSVVIEKKTTSEHKKAAIKTKDETKIVARKSLPNPGSTFQQSNSMLISQGSSYKGPKTSRKTLTATRRVDKVKHERTWTQTLSAADPVEAPRNLKQHSNEYHSQLDIQERSLNEIMKQHNIIPSTVMLRDIMELPCYHYQTVASIGYAIPAHGIIIKCLKNCSNFQLTFSNLDNMRAVMHDHFQTHHSDNLHWHGFCQVCEKYIHDPEKTKKSSKFTMQEELKHIIDYHVL